MNPTRRKFTQLAVSSALFSGYLSAPGISAASSRWHERIAEKARRLAGQDPLQLLVPHGSVANVNAGTDAFTAISGVECVITEVPVDEIGVELILNAKTGDESIDVALPATFALPDLAQANAIASLDELAEKYEPADFSTGHLYRNGDYYGGKLYGYQTDGDAYLMFYNKRLLEDPVEQASYKELTGKPLTVAQSWEDLDTMMEFFHRPEQGQFGGCLFRNPGYLVWEWWARFHAKGYFPVDENMTPNINNAAGIAALAELIAASDYQSPASRSNGLFENWADFATDNIFCNIGWGGTQKYLRGQPAMRDNIVHAPLPGPVVDDQPSTMGYFNWGWNYTVSTQSRQPELAYLLTLFCTSPAISTLAVREPDGFFDPFRDSHYNDSDIESVYGKSFLTAHQQSLNNCIPDFYLSGQSSYLDVLRQQILAAMNGEHSPDKALDICAQQWKQLTRRLGSRKQRVQWQALQKTYPVRLQSALLSR